MPLNIHEIERSLRQVGFAVTAVFMLMGVVRAAGKPSPRFVSVPLRLLAEGDLTKYWTLKSAELRETPSATWGYVGIQNVSNTPIERARFYGEYFDAQGRFCFSLAFSLASNEGGLDSPSRPGEVRSLRSMAASLSPAVAPKELRLYLVGQRSLTGQHVEGEGTPPMRVPVIISGGLAESLSSVILKGELAPPDDSIRDLVLARVRVDSTGRPEKVEVVHAISDKLLQWFQDYVSGVRFTAASRGKIPEAGDTLLLVRAVASRNAFENSDFLPRLSPRVTTYLASTYDNEVAPVSTLLFVPAPTRVKRLGSGDWVNLPPPPPGLFSIFFDGTDWCSGLFESKAGRISGQFVLEWRE